MQGEEGECLPFRSPRRSGRVIVGKEESSFGDDNAL